MVQPLRLRRATRLCLTRLDRKARDADLRVRCRVLLKVHAGQSPNRAAREIGCHSATAYRIVARFRVRVEDHEAVEDPLGNAATGRGLSVADGAPTAAMG